MINALHPVRVPGSEEALRDLARAREDIRGDLMRAGHRLGKLLLGHDIRYDATGAQLDLAPPPTAFEGPAGAARRADDVPGLSRRNRRACDPPRHARGDDRSARPHIARGAEHHQATVPARDRHADAVTRRGGTRRSSSSARWRRANRGFGAG
jgi:hypothetical protein